MKVTQQSMFPQQIKNKRVYRKIDFSQKKRIARVLHLGAGLQSSCLAEMSVEGDLDPFDIVIFADTGDEPSWVYEQVEYLKTRIDVVVVSKGNIVGDLKYGEGRFATMPFYTKDEQGHTGILRRQCTREYKIEVIDNYIRDWAIERGYGKLSKNSSRLINKDVYIESSFGISYDEIERLSDRSSAWQKDIYPLIDLKWGRDDCEKYLKEKGLPIPKKSSCRVCPFHRDPYWQDLKENHPEDFEHSCQFDDWLRSDDAGMRLTLGLNSNIYLHESCIPLREVEFDKSAKDFPLFCGPHCMT